MYFRQLSLFLQAYSFFRARGRIPIRQIFHTVQRQIEAVAGKTIVDLNNFPYFDHDPQKFRCTFSLLTWKRMLKESSLLSQITARRTDTRREAICV